MSLAQNPQAMAELGLGTAPGADGQPASRTDVRRRRRGRRSGSFGGHARNRKAVAGLVILAPLPAARAARARASRPEIPTSITGLGSQPPSPEHLLGTTAKGQDVLALTIWGRALIAVRRLHRRHPGNPRRPARRSRVGLSSAAASTSRSRSSPTSSCCCPACRCSSSSPRSCRPGLGTVILVLVITGWAGSARVLRSQALSIRGKDFVAAAIVTGERGSGSCSGRSCRTWRPSS